MKPDDYPVRVDRHTARKLLAVNDDRTFRKIIDANPHIVHRIPGEVRAKYLTRELLALLPPVPGVRTLGDKRT
jgi:hypothetical protein